jgi:hypothetical protein
MGKPLSADFFWAKETCFSEKPGPAHKAKRVESRNMAGVRPRKNFSKNFEAKHLKTKQLGL